MDKECKKGYHWCPIEKKCIKTDNKKQGKGPIGIPKKKIIEGLNYVMETEASKEQVKKWWKDHDNMKQKSIDHAKSRDKLKTRMAMNKKQRGHYENDPKSNPILKVQEVKDLVMEIIVINHIKRKKIFYINQII